MKHIALAAVAALASAGLHAEDAPAIDCHVGIYRLVGGGLVDIAPSEGNKLRWRKMDGTSGALAPSADGGWTSYFGWTDRTDGKRVSFSTCEHGEIHFGGRTGHRVPLDVTDTTFKGHDVDLAGRLLLPRGRGPVPIVVFVHGAEHDSARESYFQQRLFPANGVGAFVYDKRGTGASGGSYSQDFELLADDAVAAMREAKRLAGARGGRIGYQGGSQGGWVAPIAATRAPVDFVIVSFGLAVSVIEEDRQEVALEMSLKGHTPEDIAKALEVADAAETVIASRFTQGLDRFDALRDRYRNEPWYRDLHGNFTWAVLPYTQAQLRESGSQYDWGTPFYYDPMPTLRAVKAPQLWVLGSDDLQAPSAQTSRRIISLIADRRPITLVVFPGAEHGILEYETKPDGERVSTRYSAGYFQLMVDFARDGRLKENYGRSSITLAAP